MPHERQAFLAWLLVIESRLRLGFERGVVMGAFGREYVEALMSLHLYGSPLVEVEAGGTE